MNETQATQARTERFEAERKRIAGVLHKATGRGTGYPVDIVSDGAGMSPMRLYNFLRHAAPQSCERTKLTLEEGLALLGQLPVEVANEVLAPYGLIADRFASNEAGCYDAAAEACLDFAHEHSKWRRVGKICHRARAAISPKALNAGRWLASLLRVQRKAAA